MSKSLTRSERIEKLRLRNETLVAIEETQERISRMMEEQAKSMDGGLRFDSHKLVDENLDSLEDQLKWIEHFKEQVDELETLAEQYDEITAELKD